MVRARFHQKREILRIPFLLSNHLSSSGAQHILHEAIVSAKPAGNGRVFCWTGKLNWFNRMAKSSVGRRESEGKEKGKESDLVRKR